MKRLLPLFLSLTYFTAISQTGPGGCGSSANNVLWLASNKGITLAGGGVDVWADQSGNGNNATANGASARPTFVSSSVNGFPSLDFDGVNDEMWVPDAASLDVTQWHIFIVVIADNLKNFNAWLVKGDDGSENFELLSYSDGNIHSPIRWTDGTRTFPSSAAGQVNTTTFEIIEYSYKNTVGRDVWKNNGAAAITTDNENKTPANNALQVYIGNERSTAGRFVDGDIAEVIIYNAPLNSAQKIIVNNYLAAKYNRTLGVNDNYTMDNAGNGNYDYDVAGIGQVDASNFQNDSRGSGIVRVLNPTGLGNDEFFIFGHDNATLGTYGSTDYPPGLAGRWFRTWRVSEVNATGGAAVDVGNVDIRFDLTGLGAVTVTDLRLLVDTDNDGVFIDETAISGAVSYGSNIYGFTGVSTIGNNMRFTLGTINRGQTPLPIELLNFDAVLNEEKVDLTWTTAAEINNDYFTVERSKTGEQWEEVLRVDGAGNSNTVIQYADFDANPLKGISYYRLKQTDFNGTSTYSEVRVVKNETGTQAGISPFPNPSDGNSFNLEFTGFGDEDILVVVRDIQGKEFYSKIHAVSDGTSIRAIDLENTLSPGTYLVIASSQETMVSKKIIVK